MSKSPEEYFQDQHFAPAAPVRGAAFTEAELSFMRKYMGLDTPDTHEILGQLGIKSEAQAVVEHVPDPAGPELVAAPAPPEAVVEPQDAPREDRDAPAPEPVTAVAQDDPEDVDSSDVETFQETVEQQFLFIRTALDGLRNNGKDISFADALYRGLITVQNSSSYMGLNDIKVYAERTAGIVDQGRKTGTDFSVMTELLQQESGIIEDMVTKAIAAMLGDVPPDSQEPEAVVADAPAPEPEPAVEIAPNTPAQPAPAEAGSPVSEAVREPAPLPSLALAETSVSTSEAILKPPPEPVPAPVSVPEPVTAPAQVPVYREEPPGDAHHEMSVEEPLDSILRKEAELLMVGFYIGKQEFTVPTLAVQEVIRYEAPSKMPAAPKFVAGVINLRGKITPLVYLRDMLEIRQAREGEERFIIVCRRKGLQIGLIIDRVHTMYRVPQSDIEWGIEGLLGINNADFVSGLLKLNESLVGIVSVDCIVDYVLE